MKSWPEVYIPTIDSKFDTPNLQLFNSHSRKIEKLPSKKTFRMYVCGITPYDSTHLGHAATYLSFDLINRYLRAMKSEVLFVENITDIDDPLLVRAARDGINWQDLADSQIELFRSDMTSLRVLPPKFYIGAVEAIGLVTTKIEELKSAGAIYSVENDLYFRVHSDPDFGSRSHLSVDDCLKTFAERGGDPERVGKENPLDSLVWLSKRENEPGWPSIHGEGRPGWHIECSAMATKYLGKKFDIHGGGMDLQFPHHECEIAQSTVCNHEIPARYWMHNNMITINGRKMGKSYNNVIKLSELFSGNHHELTQAYTPMTVRFFILQSQYRGTLDFSNEALQASEKALRRLMEAYEWLKAQSFVAGTTAKDDNLDAQVNTWLKELTEFMEDDFNTAKVVANLFEIIPTINSLKDKHITIDALSGATWIFAQEQLTLFIENILGLKVDTGANRQQLNSVIQLLIEIRKDAKARKDFATSDKIRNQLTDMGIQLKDEKDGEMSYTFA